MLFTPVLHPAKLLCRYKRFLADISLPNGDVTTIYCPNTGSMKRCVVENSPCWYSISSHATRKYPFTLELVTTASGHLAGVNTGRANTLVKEAIVNGVIIELQGYANIQAEVNYGEERSRIDFLLSGDGINDCYVEVKSVTLGMEGGRGLFPDSVSARGTKHLRELMAMVLQGHRAVLVFCVQHVGIDSVSPADDIDPVYGATLRQAIQAGVEVLIYGAEITPESITLTQPLSLLL